jgi:hypothetical protein
MLAPFGRGGEGVGQGSGRGRELRPRAQGSSATEAESHVVVRALGWVEGVMPPGRKYIAPRGEVRQSGRENACTKTEETVIWVLRLSVVMDLYIHPLYILVIKILSSIFNSSAPIHPLYHSLSTVGLIYHFI